MQRSYKSERCRNFGNPAIAAFDSFGRHYHLIVLLAGSLPDEGAHLIEFLRQRLPQDDFHAEGREFRLKLEQSAAAGVLVPSPESWM